MFMQTKTTREGKRVSHLHWIFSLLLSMALSLGTWNPSGNHFLAYISESDPLSGFKPFFILVMIALWVMAIKAILQTIKVYGAAIIVAIIVAFVWGLSEYGILDTSQWDTLGWIVSIGIGVIVWIALNASIIWKRVTGVYTTDVAEEG